jgi:cell division protein FtsZ
MVEYERTPTSESPDGSLKICVVGVGGAGSNVIDRITVDRTISATLVSLQTDVRVLNQSMAPKKVQLGAELMRGVGTGGDPDLGREAAIYSKDRIREMLEGHHMVFLSVGLGGGTGSGAAPVVAEIAKRLGALVVVFAAVPFSFEGRRRQQQAHEALERLQKCSDALILFDNNRMGELVLGKEGIQKTFAQADTLIGHSVRAVSTMVSKPGLVKLGLADLVAALRVSDGRCLFGFGEAKGKERGVEAMKRALKSPLISSGELLRNARNLLVHVVGGESLTLAEVDTVMKQLGRHVPDETQILFGVGVDPTLGESVTVTLISALSADELASAKAVPDETTRVQPRTLDTSSKASPVVSEEFAPPADLFSEPSAPVVAAPAAVVKAPAFAPPTTPPPAPPPAALAPEPAPSPPPMPVMVKAVEPEPELVPLAIEEPEPPAPVVVSEPEPEPVLHTAAARGGFSLASVISGNDGGLRSNTPRNEDRRYAPAPIVEPVAETAPVALPISRTQVVSRTATEPVQVTVNVPALELTPEPEPAEPVGSDLFGNVSSSATAVASAPITARSTAEEQANLRLGGEDRGRFNGTEPAVVQGEDLDTPTWMRLRRRPGR